MLPVQGPLSPWASACTSVRLSPSHPANVDLAGEDCRRYNDIPHRTVGGQDGTGPMSSVGAVLLSWVVRRGLVQISLNMPRHSNAVEELCLARAVNSGNRRGCFPKEQAE